jgi:3-deoxy-7-phosphoheptulonate synthase
MARAAIAAGADGVMIDVHHDPGEALCDGPQALTPGDLLELSKDLNALALALGRQLV